MDWPSCNCSSLLVGLYVSAVFFVFGIITHLSSAANNAAVTRYHMHNYLQAKYKRNTKISFPDSLGNHIRYLKSKIQLQAAYRRILSCQCTADSPQIDYERYLASRGQTQHGGRRNQEQQTQHTRISTIHGNRYEVCSFPHLLYKRNLHVKIIISVIAILRKKK